MATTTLLGTVYTINDIRKALKTQKGIEKAIIRIYEYQTKTEQTHKDTHLTNGVGFNKPDAKKMTNYATWINRGNHLDGKFYEDAQTRIQKYAGQLLRIANGEL